MAGMRHIAAGLALSAVVVLAALVAVQERASRSPSALMQQSLYYPGYPYVNPGYGYDYYSAGSYYPYTPSYQAPGYGYAGAYYDPYYDDAAYQQYAAHEQYRQWSDYVRQQQDQDYAEQQSYDDYIANYPGYKAQAADSKLKVASDKNTNKLVYLGDLEFGGYRHDITGGNDGGYNAPYDINGDGQELDNWGKAVTAWKQKQAKQQTLRQTGLAQRQQARTTALLNEPDLTNPYDNSASPADYVWQKGFGWLTEAPVQAA